MSVPSPTPPTAPGIRSYQNLQGYMYAILLTNGQEQDVENVSPHGAFWYTLSYNDFITMNVPGVSPPLRIVTPGHPDKSNFILALQGTGPFGPTGNIGQMPADGPPFFTAAQIQPIIDWVNAGCPE